MADEMRRVLDHIVSHFVVRDEQKSIELEAASGEPGAAIESDKKQVARREAERADELANAFARGITLAYRRYSIGGIELPLDDRKPEEDRMADALIRFLVSYELAASRTEETTPQHYIYYIAVDWTRLGRLARDAGVDLERALRDRRGG